MSRAIAAAVGRPARPGGRASAQSRIAGIEVLPEYLEVLDQIRKGTPLILVTGGAGTGKSTFIRWLEERYRGEILLFAPTGIAALTIGGRTIHSLCKFPPAYILPRDIRIDPKPLLLSITHFPRRSACRCLALAVGSQGPDYAARGNPHLGSSLCVQVQSIRLLPVNEECKKQGMTISCGRDR